MFEESCFHRAWSAVWPNPSPRSAASCQNQPGVSATSANPSPLGFHPGTDIPARPAQVRILATSEPAPPNRPALAMDGRRSHTEYLIRAPLSLGAHRWLGETTSFCPLGARRSTTMRVLPEAVPSILRSPETQLAARLANPGTGLRPTMGYTAAIRRTSRSRTRSFWSFLH